MTAEVEYQIAAYSGTVHVNCNENDEDDFIIAKAKRILKNRVGSFPMGYENWKVISRT